MENPQAPIQPPKKPEQPIVAKVQPNAPVKGSTVKPKPAGWFSYKQSGMRPAVVKDIQASKELPDGDRAKLLADIALLDPALNYVSVDCHRHCGKADSTTHATIKGKIVLAG